MMATDEAQRLERQRAVLQTVADKLLERHLEAPAILMLESIKPLSFIASQGLVFMGPLLQAVLAVQDYDTFAEALENRENVEWLIQRLEAGEGSRESRDASSE